MFTPDAPALPARSLPGLLHGLVQTQPDAPAIRWLDTATDTRSDWSFARLNAVADTLARCFEALRGEPLQVASRDPRLRAQTYGVRFVDSAC